MSEATDSAVTLPRWAAGLLAVALPVAGVGGGWTLHEGSESPAVMAVQIQGLREDVRDLRGELRVMNDRTEARTASRWTSNDMREWVAAQHDPLRADLADLQRRVLDLEREAPHPRPR